MLAVGALGIFVWLSGGAPWRFPAEIRPVLASMDYSPTIAARYPSCWLDSIAGFESYAPECRKGSTLIWGDSHAARLYTGMKRETAQFTRNSCEPLINFGYPVCAKSNVSIVDEIKRLKPRHLIMFAAWANYAADRSFGPEQINSLDATLKALGGITDIVVLGPAPVWTPPLPKLVYTYWRISNEIPDRFDPEPSVDYLAIDRAIKSVAEANGARFISLFDMLCNDDGCLTHTPAARSDLISLDYGHLTTDGARFIADQAGLN